MKTVQEYLRNADRKELLDSIVYDLICDPQMLLEHKDKTVAKIQTTCRNNMNAFIDHLVSLKAVPSDHMVLYICDTALYDRHSNCEDKVLYLIDLNEVRQDIKADSYGFDLTDWEETLGYLVADNKLTQDHITELLTQYLDEISFFGIDPGLHNKKINEVHESLEQAMKEIEDGHTIPADEVFKELAIKHGFPLEEKDDIQEQFNAEVVNAAIRYNSYCQWRERSRILKSLGETAPEFEENEQCDN